MHQLTEDTRRGALRFQQFHNQPAHSVLHQALEKLWSEVALESDGKVVVEVLPENNKMPGGDPEVLRRVIDGSIAFYAQMGSLFSSVVPAADVQGIPFAFQNREQVFAALDGALGDYLRTEMRAKGIHTLPKACLENGFHHISLTRRRVRELGDMQGLIIRTPKSDLFVEFFEALGARPVSTNIDQMYEALRSNTVEAQQNPLAVVELFKLQDIQPHITLTGHMWSGFNLVASLDCWERIPPSLQAMIEAKAAAHTARQRSEQHALNESLRSTLAKRGTIFDTVDPKPFRARVAALYPRWRSRVGTRAWALLEQFAGAMR
jgi:TRAP-type transport system periplasmic protein